MPSEVDQNALISTNPHVINVYRSLIAILSSEEIDWKIQEEIANKVWRELNSDKNSVYTCFNKAAILALTTNKKIDESIKKALLFWINDRNSRYIPSNVYFELLSEDNVPYSIRLKIASQIGNQQKYNYSALADTFLKWSEKLSEEQKSELLSKLFKWIADQQFQAWMRSELGRR